MNRKHGADRSIKRLVNGESLIILFKYQFKMRKYFSKYLKRSKGMNCEDDEFHTCVSLKFFNHLFNFCLIFTLIFTVIYEFAIFISFRFSLKIGSNIFPFLSS